MTIVIAPKKVGKKGNDPSGIALQEDNVLSIIFGFLDLPDLPSISRTCKQWKRLDDIICREWMKKHHPKIEKLVEHFPPKSCTWKGIVEQRHTPPTKESSLNKELQMDFDTLFRPAGIVAYSFSSSTLVLPEFLLDRSFVARKRGIYFFSLCIDNGDEDEYSSSPTSVMVYYRDFEYLLSHWKTECGFIHAWCGVLGMDETHYTIQKPQDASRLIVIKFQIALKLESWPFIVALVELMIRVHVLTDVARGLLEDNQDIMGPE